MSERICALTPCKLGAVVVGDPFENIQTGRGRCKLPQDDPSIPGVVSNERVDIESTVICVAVVDEFNSCGNRIDCAARLLGRERLVARIQISTQTNADLEFESEATVVSHR